jgi:hypothetical protein
LIKALKEKIRKRKNKSLTEVLVLYLIIGLMLTLVFLAGCNYNMVPHETKIEYGTVDIDAKNDKLQQKKSIIQIWKWKQHD